jgi:cytoskeletal protein RodZ
MEPIGERLKKARLEKGLTLEDAHRKTKIHLNILKGIEEGSLVNFSPVYIKGFLKIYCKFLGIEYSDSLLEHRQQPQPAMRPIEEKRRCLSVVNARPVCAEALTFIRKRFKAALAIGIILIVIISLFNLGKFISLRKFPQTPKKAVISAKALSLPLKHKRKSEQPAATKSPKPEKPTAIIWPNPQKPAEAVFTGIRLGIRAREDCWLQVKSDGKTIFQNILKKGRFENWQAKEKIELSLGNAGVVELEVNGKFISSLGRRGQAVKNILITKEGLTTSR